MLFSSTVLSPEKTKWIADIIIYNTLNIQDYRRITDRPLSSFKGQVLEEYIYELDDYMPKETFLREFNSLRLKFDLHGQQEVWREFTYIQEYCRKELKNKGLFGNQLEDAIKNKIEILLYKIDIDKWDCEARPLLTGLVIQAYNFFAVSKRLEQESQTLQSDIKINGEDSSSFSVNNDFVTDDFKTRELLYSSSFYTKCLGDIYKGSQVLFTDNSRGKSNLYELYFSIANYMQAEDLKKIQSELETIYKDVKIDNRIENPIKSMYPDAGGIRWGHLLYTNPNYVNIQPGNQSIINSIVDAGKSILAALMQILNENDLIRDNKGIFLAQVTAKLQDRFFDEASNSYALRTEAKLKPYNIWLILKGVQACNKLCEVLQASGHRIGAFPSVEIRQQTYGRFSNLYEQLTYYDIHEEIDQILRLDYSNGLGQTNLTKDDLEAKPKKATFSEFEVLKRANKLKLKMRVDIRSSRNKKEVISYDKDGYTYECASDMLGGELKESLSAGRIIFNADLNQFISYVILLVELSLHFVDIHKIGNKPNFKVFLDNAMEPKTENYKLLLKSILKLEIPEEITNKTALVHKVDSFASTPQNVIRLLFEEHKKINDYILKIQGEDYYNPFLDNPILYNLNFVLNTELDKIMLIRLRESYFAVRSLMGYDKSNIQTRDITPISQGVVFLANNKKLMGIMRCKEFPRFARGAVASILSKYNVQLPGLYTESIRELSPFADNIFHTVYQQLDAIFRGNMLINYNDEDIDTRQVNSKALEYERISANFKNYMRLNSAYVFNEALSTLNFEIYRMSPSSTIIGKNNIPLRKESNIKGKYFIYSIFGIKTLYPTGEQISMMTEADVQFIQEQFQ